MTRDPPSALIRQARTIDPGAAGRACLDGAKGPTCGGHGTRAQRWTDASIILIESLGWMTRVSFNYCKQIICVLAQYLLVEKISVQGARR